MYRAAIRERARDGIVAHGSLGAYLSDLSLVLCGFPPQKK